jgi:hypothetical protein
MEPRLRSTETLEGVNRRSFHLIRYFRPGDGVSQIRQGSLDPTVHLHDYAGPACVSPLLISYFEGDFATKTQGLDRGVEDRAIGPGIHEGAQRHVA